MKTYKLIHTHNLQPVTRAQLAEVGARYLPLTLNRETPPTRVPEGMAWAEVVGRPTYDPDTQKLVANNSVEKLDWKIVPLTEEEIAAREAARNPVPGQIENWRAKAILEMQGMLEAVENIIATLEGEQGIIVRRAWNDGSPLTRHGPTVTAMASQLGLEPEQVDDMFRAAAALEV